MTVLYRILPASVILPVPFIPKKDIADYSFLLLLHFGDAVKSSVVILLCPILCYGYNRALSSLFQQCRAICCIPEYFFLHSSIQ